MIPLRFMYILIIKMFILSKRKCIELINLLLIEISKKSFNDKRLAFTQKRFRNISRQDLLSELEKVRLFLCNSALLICWFF